MERILTKFTFYYNTPLVDFFNTIHFKSQLLRDKFFKECSWKKLEFEESYNFEKNKGELLIKTNIYDFKNLQGINYCRFKNGNDNKYYYAFVVKIEYVNQNVTRLYLVIDVLMTYTQGLYLNNLKGLNIEREHLSRESYNNMLEYLQKNNDILLTNTKKIKFENGLYFDDYVLLVISSAYLGGGFGDLNNPKIVGSFGGKVDNIYSPLDLYMIKNKFDIFFTNLSNFPWVQQHIQKIIMLPKMFIDESKFSEVKSDLKVNIYKANNNSNFNNSDLLKSKLNDLSLSYNELINLLKIKEDEKHLLRPEYFNINLYDNMGNSLGIDLSNITEKYGLTFDCVKVVGYENIVTFFVKNYNTSKDILILQGKGVNENPKTYGAFTNESITFNNFDNLPIAINKAELNLSNTANQRKLTESRLFSGRLNNIVSGTETTSKLYDAISLTSNISIANLFGRLNDEYNYYRDLQASNEDKKLEPPTITQSNNYNALTRNNNCYGLNLKIFAPSNYEMNLIKNYYKCMGYKVDKRIDKLDNIQSMNFINYVKFSGSFNLNGIDTAHQEILREIFKQGVRLWHYDKDVDGNTFMFSSDKVLGNRWL